MVGQEMIAGRVCISMAAAICVIAALNGGGVRAADNPSGFDPGEDASGRPVAIMPSAALIAPLRSTTDNRATDEPATGNPLWGIPIEALHATRERPLFSPSRRPPPPAVTPAPAEPVKVAAPPPQPDEPALTLLGIVAGDGEGYAVFVNTTTHDIVRLKTGEGDNGWILRSVRGREAVLEKNHRTAILGLPPIAGVQTSKP
jgi:general secretion pathway protein N